MHWIALWWPPEATADAASSPGGEGQPGAKVADGSVSPEAQGWWALGFTPRVTRLDEALLLEVQACERLWGGRGSLVRELIATQPMAAPLHLGQGASSLVALACLRLRAAGEEPPERLPHDLPLHTLSAAREHLAVLSHLGCRTWGDLHALPRGGLVRRFGQGLRDALDTAWGLRPDEHRWLALPAVFERRLELPALADSAPQLMWSVQRLLGDLQAWLRARQRGVLALELRWVLDLRRVDGVELPRTQSLVVRTAEPTQDTAHLRRLFAERLDRTRLPAPANAIRLRSVDTTPWAGADLSFLPEDNRRGDRLHELVERLSVRLGREQVLGAVAQQDHRPEHKQRWQPALLGTPSVRRAPVTAGRRAGASRGAPAAAASRVSASMPATATTSTSSTSASASATGADALYPTWMLREPRPLPMRGEHPVYLGVLRRLVGPQRVEAGWWGDGRPAVRDYYIAESPEAGLVWIYRERPGSCFAEGEVRWYLQGLYA